MRFGIRGKIISITIAVMLFAVSLNTLISSRMYKKSHFAALRSGMCVVCLDLKSQIQRVLESGIPLGDIEGFERQCREVLDRHCDVDYAIIVNGNGRILFHNNPALHGTMVADPKVLKAIRGRQETISVSRQSGRTYYNMITPLEGGLNDIAAAAVIGVPTEVVDSKLRKLVYYCVLVGLVSFAGATTLLLVSISALVTKPLSKLLGTIQEIRSSSDLGKRVDVTSTDEVGCLAQSFNMLTEKLQKSTTSADNLNQEIELRKRIERSLRHSEEKYRVLLTNIPQKIFYKDFNSVYLLCNESFAEEFDLKPAELKGLTDYDLFPGELADKYKADDRRIMESGIAEEIQEEYIKDGRRLVVHTCKVPVRDENANVIGIFGIFWDITAQSEAEEHQSQLLEQLRKVNQELTNFAYVVSHDLKAPLRGIKTLAEWISTDYADKLDEKGKEQMKLLGSRVDRLHGLIDGVLEYSRVGCVKEQQTQVNLSRLLPAVIDMLAPPENIEIIIENELPTVLCEQTRISQVFQNLLSNAIRYTDKPKGQIEIGCIDRSDFWQFSVADNGPGIEEKYFEKIFKIFQTLSSRDEYESSGVGLTVVKKIIELYGGSIWVESEVGEGTTFFFTLSKHEMGVKDEKLEADIVGRG